MDNGTIRAIFERRSIRSFLPEPLTQYELETLRQVALASPSAMDRQPWHFHFITSQDVIRQLSEAALDTFRREGDQATLDRMAARHPSIFYGAPLLVVISTGQNNPARLDVGIAAENLAIAAQSMGLGSCLIGLVDAAFRGAQTSLMANLIKMPEGFRCAFSIAIGHPASTKEAHLRHPEKITMIE
jgi:nitroreductase